MLVLLVLLVSAVQFVRNLSEGSAGRATPASTSPPPLRMWLVSNRMASPPPTAGGRKPTEPSHAPCLSNGLSVATANGRRWKVSKSSEAMWPQPSFSLLGGWAQDSPLLHEVETAAVGEDRVQVPRAVRVRGQVEDRARAAKQAAPMPRGPFSSLQSNSS